MHRELKPKDPEVLRPDLQTRWQQISPEDFHVFPQFLQASGVTERHTTSRPPPPTSLPIHSSPTVTQPEQHNDNNVNRQGHCAHSAVKRNVQNI